MSGSVGCVLVRLAFQSQTQCAAQNPAILQFHLQLVVILYCLPVDRKGRAYRWLFEFGILQEEESSEDVW